MTVEMGAGRGKKSQDDEVEETEEVEAVEEAEEIEAEEDGEELDFEDEDEALPWLDSDYEEEDEGVDIGRVIGFGLLSLLALGLIIGGIWWFTNRGTDPELVADGSTIEAPEGAVKEKPEDEGGKQFEGTGNVAPAVGEGQSREGQMADGNAPKPSIDAATTGNTAGSSSSGGSGQQASSGSSSGVGVQVGAYSTRESAVAGWASLTRQTSALSGVKYRIEKGQADIGTVYRLQAVAGDAAAARKLCNALKADGVACQVKR